MTHPFLPVVYVVVNIFLVSVRIGISSVICKGILPGIGVVILEIRRHLREVDSPNDRGSDLQQDDGDKHDGELNRWEKSGQRVARNMQRSSGTYNDEQGPQVEARAYETDRRDAECSGASSDQKTCPGRDFALSNKTGAFPFHGQVDSNCKDDRSNDLKRKVY